MYGASRIGCAAGGEPIHISQLRESGVRRWDRRRRMERSWAIQNVFLACCFGIPAFSAVVVNQGLNPLLESLDEVSQTAGSYREKAKQGIGIAKILHSQYNNLNFYSEVSWEEICQNRSIVTESKPNDDMYIAWAGLQRSISTLGTFVAGGTDKFVNVMFQVVDASEGVQDGVVEANDQKWIVRFFLCLISGLAAFLALGALLAKNQINHAPTQSAMAYFFLPLFALTLMGFVICTCVVASFAVVNAGKVVCSSISQKTLRR